MDKSFKRLFSWVGLGLVLLIFLVIVNQIYQIFITTSAIHPDFGRAVTILITVAFLVLMGIPLLGFMKLRKPLVFPDEGDGKAIEIYLLKLKKRYEKNPHLAKLGFTFDETKEIQDQVEDAVGQLDRQAMTVMNESASQVFITTAISQNGTLDGLFVMLNLSRLVWKISHIYNQRPTVQEIFYLYTNVAITVLMAREVEDLVLLDEQLEPLIDSLIGGTLSRMVPGATQVSNLILSSVMEGSVNAFLTLRVAALTKRYSTAITKPDRRAVKKFATLEALTLFRTIVTQNTITIVKAFALASKHATVDRTIDKIKRGTVQTGTYVKDLFRKPEDEDEKDIPK